MVYLSNEICIKVSALLNGSWSSEETLGGFSSAFALRLVRLQQDDRREECDFTDQTLFHFCVKDYGDLNRSCSEAYILSEEKT